MSKNLKIIVKSNSKHHRKIKSILKGSVAPQKKEKKSPEAERTDLNPTLISQLVSALSRTGQQETELKEIVSKIGDPDNVIQKVGFIQSLISGNTPKPSLAPPAATPQLMNKPKNYKTVPCRLFHSSVGCLRGDYCHYIHDYNFPGVETPNMNKYVRPIHMLSKGKEFAALNTTENGDIPFVGNPQMNPMNILNQPKHSVPTMAPQTSFSQANFQFGFQNNYAHKTSPNNPNFFPANNQFMPNANQNNAFPMQMFPNMAMQNMIQSNNLLKNIMPQFLSNGFFNGKN